MILHKQSHQSIEYYCKQNENKSTTEIVMNHKSKEPPQKTITHKKKNKGQFFMMLKNIEKLLYSHGIFIRHENNFDKIHIYKDLLIHINIYGHKAELNIRYEIGIWEDFSKCLKENPTNFDLLKTSFFKWLNLHFDHNRVEDELQLEVDKLFAPHIQDAHYKKYLPKLIEEILKLNKPSKQINGFKKKIAQVYFYWHLESSEVKHIEEVEKILCLNSYENSFLLARSLKRTVSIFIGPTNSGKTFNALNVLSNAKSGLYLAPLRLMAAEGQEALLNQGIATNLITGEEQKILDRATHVSSTIEMCNFSTTIDVAVIDEIQMISDKDRGWAWSQALIGTPAKQLILVGSEDALPYILPILDLLKEEYKIHNFERKSPLTYREPLSKISDLREGDCVIVFSRKNALDMKQKIEQSNKKCSVIYGNLSPEVRRHEAAKFKNGENPILVATDAIGMGLNLPINRLFFSTMEKFDGEKERQLTISETKQIAGRSGRYGITQTGEVGLLAYSDQAAISLLKTSLCSHYPKEKDTRISISPNINQLKTICEVIHKHDVYSSLIFFKEKLIKNHEIYKTSKIDSMLGISAIIRNKNLDIAMAFTYSCTPIDPNNETAIKYFFGWINNHIHGIPNKAIPLNKSYTQLIDSQALFHLENYVKLCMAYRWLHYKFPAQYPDMDETIRSVEKANHLIEQALERQNLTKRKPV